VDVDEGILPSCPVLANDGILYDLWDDESVTSGAVGSRGYTVGNIEASGKFNFIVSGYDAMILVKLLSSDEAESTYLSF
jgi:hypothetical protein